MKFLYLLIFSVASVWANAEQINYLTQDFYGFEDGGTAYWIQNDEWSVTTEKAADGTDFSIKFTSPTELDGQKKAHGGSNGSGISLPVGTYTLKLKVWVASDNTMEAFNFTIKNPKWLNNPMKIDTVTREKWVELSKEFTVTEEIVESGSLLTAYNGKGTFYVDEIQIWGEGEVEIEPELLPFKSKISSINEGNISLPKGHYDVSVQVFVPDTTTIGKFYTQIELPWSALTWKLDTVQKGQWVELIQPLELEQDADQSPFNIIFSNHPDFGGGKGKLFIDDIKFNWNRGLSVDDVSSIDFKIYPNPASEYVFVECENAGAYRMYSIRGQIVKSGIISNIRQSIPIGDLKSGTYLLQIKTDKGNTVKQLIIQ